MKKIALVAAAVLALSGSAFAANTDHQLSDASAPQALNPQQTVIDYSTTASIRDVANVSQARPTAQDVQQHRVDGNPNEY